MPRPGFVLDVDERTPPILTIGGTRLRLQRFGLGTRVAYPAEGEPSQDPGALLTAALAAPLSGDPLLDRMRTVQRLTIVFGDARQPRPAMKFDARRDAAERVLELAARAGVDDVELVAATGLRPQLTEADFISLLGERVVRSFITEGGLGNHDVMDDAGMVSIGSAAGHDVRLNARVASSDLVVNIVVRSGKRSDMPLQQVITGLTDVATIDHVAGLDGQRDPTRAEAVAALVTEKVPIVTVEVVLGTPVFDAPLAFVGKREWEWSIADQLSWVGMRQVLTTAPKQASNRVFGSLRADYAVLDVIVGDPLQADAQGRQVWSAANAAPLPTGVDVLATSVWGIGQDASDPVGSPLAAAHHALVRPGQSSSLRDGGVQVAFHPLRNRFSNRYDTAAADFFADVLPVTRDPEQVRDQFQERFAADPWYATLYGTQHAFHPLFVFHQWYATVAAASRLSDVIWVGGDRESARVLGHRAASTWDDALEIAANSVGATPNVLVLR